MSIEERLSPEKRRLIELVGDLLATNPTLEVSQKLSFYTGMFYHEYSAQMKNPNFTRNMDRIMSGYLHTKLKEYFLEEEDEDRD